MDLGVLVRAGGYSRMDVLSMAGYEQRRLWFL